MTPTKATLRRYGLTLADWRYMYREQKGCCAICQQPSKRLCVDHEHAPGWANWPPKVRRNTVRGLTCWICNYRILTRGVTPAKLRRAADYLEGRV